MTCVSAVSDGESVWVGADSAGVAGWASQVRADAKVFELGPFVMGFTTSFRMGQLLRYRLEPPQHDGQDDLEYLATGFVDAVRRCLKDGGFAKKEAEVESGGTFILGYRGEIYVVQSDYQVAMPALRYAAVGCGDDLALGSLHSTDALKRHGPHGPLFEDSFPRARARPAPSSLSPEIRIQLALEAASEFSAGVRPPFRVAVGGRR